MTAGDIRALSAADAGAAHGVQLRAYPPEICEGLALFSHALSHGRCVALGVFGADGAMMGYGFAYPASPGRSNFYDGPDDCADLRAFYLHELTIDPAYQGGGLGAALYEALESRLRALGAHTILANAIEGRLAFWQRMGFTCGARADYHGMPSTLIEKNL